MSRPVRTGSLLLCGALLLGGCGSAPNQTLGPPPSAPPGGAVITAEGLVFDRAELALPAGHPFPLLFENREAAPHNVTIHVQGSPSEVLFSGEIIGGPAAITYEGPALAVGTYGFRCDVHPEMAGTATAR